MGERPTWVERQRALAGTPGKCPDCGTCVRRGYGGFEPKCDACWNGPARPERIVAAALRVDGLVWALPPPARHHVLLRAWTMSHYRDGAEPRMPKHEQGFTTNSGRFVDREEGERIARAAGQVTELIGGVLTSEDLW